MRNFCIFIVSIYISASNSLVIKEMFRSRLTRVGSLAPSTRQRRSRKGKKGMFEFFGRQRSNEENKVIIS